MYCKIYKKYSEIPITLLKNTRYYEFFDNENAAEVAAFIDAIVNDKETPLNVYDGLKPVLMGLAAKKSSEEHRPVKISEIME